MPDRNPFLPLSVRAGLVERRGSGPAFVAHDPSTGEPLLAANAADASDVDLAVGAAANAFPGWRRTPLAERAAMLQRFAGLVSARADDLARIISLETGKPTWEARQEVRTVVGKIPLVIEAQQARAADITRAGARTVFRPHGVVAVLGPYNFPAHLPNGQVAPALLAGNTVVLKPSEHTTATSHWILDRWAEAGLPPGVLGLVAGAGATGAALADHPRVDAILFTGSARVGLALHARHGGRPEKLLALEMGGNNPLVVHQVGDPAAAARVIVQSAFLSAGQRCTCARRLIVCDDAAPQGLMESVVDIASRLRRGGPFESPEPFHGPVVHAAAADAVVDAFRDLVARGGRPWLEPVRGLPATGFVSPGIVEVDGDGVPDEEVFGPLLVVSRARDLVEGIRLANRTSFGLAAGLLSEDDTAWETFQDEVRAGVLNRNVPLPGASGAAPFGGRGRSGNHRPAAWHAVDFCNVATASIEARSPLPPAPPPPGFP